MYLQQGTANAQVIPPGSSSIAGGASASAGSSSIAGGASASASSNSSLTAAAASVDSVIHNIATPSAAPIPKQALRLRIIANSDSNADQSVKLKVRNAVVVQVAEYLRGAKNAQQARTIVEAHIPQIEALAKKVVRQNGFTYAVKTNVGMVPFPTKIYGNQVYPAGNYEALRIELGKAAGMNWWCVLFPPLCFIDIAEGDAVPNTGGFPDLPPLETIKIPNQNGQMTNVQVRLASVDYGEELWHAVQNWISKHA
ncbi:stage II sporulation protein R [Alicyclobacillus sp. ALC3]|nr:stage II sporulation protein R [Alicyclobacillus sp. ALC3]